MPVRLCRAEPGFAITGAARSALRRECERHGPQAVLLSWPSGVTYLPERHFQPGEYDVVLERFAEFTVYTDSRALALFLDRRVVVDLGAVGRFSPRPPLRVRAVVDEHVCTGRCAQVPGADAYRPALNAAALEVVDELSSHFAGRFSESVLWAHARAVLAELGDSGTLDALQAQALRLVRQRLGEVAAGRLAAVGA